MREGGRIQVWDFQTGGKRQKVSHRGSSQSKQPSQIDNKQKYAKRRGKAHVKDCATTQKMKTRSQKKKLKGSTQKLSDKQKCAKRQGVVHVKECTAIHKRKTVRIQKKELKRPTQPKFKPKIKLKVKSKSRSKPKPKPNPKPKP